MAANRSKCQMVTYSLHGLNNGKSGLVDLCHNPDIVLIAMQENWLYGNNIQLLNDIHPEFSGYGISAMDNRLSTEIYRGCPYCGVAFLWRKTYSPKIHIQSKSQSGRCLSISLGVDNKNTLNVINIYLPCFNTSAEYSCELAECLGFIEDVAQWVGEILSCLAI